MPQAKAETVTLPPGLGRGVRVAILGAGMAGLCAAYELAKGGFDVKVIEANPHIGGRSLTLRPGDRFQEDPNRSPTSEMQICRFEPEIWVDGSSHVPYLNAGPGRIPHHHTMVLSYCRQLGVEMETYIFASRANLVQVDGLNGGKPLQLRRVKHDLRGYISELLAKIPDSTALNRPLTPEDREKLRDLMKEFGALGDGFLYPNPSPDRAGYAALPGAGLNAGEPWPNLNLQDMLSSEVWNIGANSLYADMRFYWQASLLQPRGGMDMIVRAFRRARIPAVREGVRTVEDLIITGTPVTNVIKNGNDPIRIIYGNQSETFDYVISTMSPQLFAGVAQGLDPTFAENLSRVRYVDTAKVGWQANYRFWERDSRIYGGISWTSHGIDQIWYPSDGFFADKGVLTGAYVRGAHGKALGDMPLAERLAFAMEGGKQLHSDMDQWIDQNKGLAIAWQYMPHFNGGWADQNAPYYEKTYRAINEQDPPVYIAGDFLSHMPGWKEGAVRAANLVVDMIGDRVGATRRNR